MCSMVLQNFTEIRLFFQPPRSAHPLIKFSCSLSEPMVLENLPFDKYELEPSPLTQYILERRQPNVAWQVCSQNVFNAACRVAIALGNLVLDSLCYL